MYATVFQVVFLWLKFSCCEEGSLLVGAGAGDSLTQWGRARKNTGCCAKGNAPLAPAAGGWRCRLTHSMRALRHPELLYYRP